MGVAQSQRARVTVLVVIYIYQGAIGCFHLAPPNEHALHASFGEAGGSLKGKARGVFSWPLGNRLYCVGLRCLSF